MERFSRGQLRVLQFLLENANAAGECLRYVKEIADATGLTRKYVTSVTSRLVKVGIITREQTFDVEEDDCGGEARYPDKNLYRILQRDHARTILETFCRSSIMSTWPAVPTVEQQLTLPFPPNERTILAQGARLVHHVSHRNLA